MATALSPARALRQPRRIDWRALFGIFLTLVAVGGSIFFWTESSDTRSIVVATRDVPSGSTLTLADLAIARVRVDDTLYQAAVPAEDLSTLTGKQLSEPIHAHQVLVRAQVSQRPSLGRDELALTIPISPETAVGGSLRPGDAVELLVTINKGAGQGRTPVALNFQQAFNAPSSPWLTLVRDSVLGKGNSLKKNNDEITAVLSQ